MARNPSKLQKYFESKYQEHISKSMDLFKNEEHKQPASKRTVKVAIGCNDENAVKASSEVDLLIAKTEKPHAIIEELMLPAAKVMLTIMTSEKAAKGPRLIAL